MFERIVLAVDSWGQAKEAAAAAVDLAAKSPGKVLVVHVHDTGLSSRQVVDPEALAGATGIAEAALNVVTTKKAGERRSLRVNQAARVTEAILAAVADFNGDVIVLGLHAPGGFAGQPLGSVAQLVLQQAGCPVVIVRAAAASSAASYPTPARPVGRARPRPARRRQGRHEGRRQV